MQKNRRVGRRIRTFRSQTAQSRQRPHPHPVAHTARKLQPLAHDDEMKSSKMDKVSWTQRRVSLAWLLSQMIAFLGRRDHSWQAVRRAIAQMLRLFQALLVIEWRHQGQRSYTWQPPS
jgi:hypothetical protein